MKPTIAGLLVLLLVGCVPSYEPKSRLAIGGEDPTFEPPVVMDPGQSAADAGMRPPPANAPDGGAMPPPEQGPTWWQDVEPVVRAECQLCHGAVPDYGAPMPLATYDDVLAASRIYPDQPVHERVAARIQRNSGFPPMPPVANGSLSTEQIAMIVEWSRNGAPEGTPPDLNKPDAGVETPDAGTEPPDAGTGNSGEEPYIYIPVVAPQAAVRPGETDLYGCFRTIIDTSEPLHAVEIAPTIDQSAVLHHILLFRDGGRNYPESRTGFLCAADTVLQQDWELLHGWAPGGETMFLPPEAGVRLEDGDHLVVQLHYNNYGSQTMVDSSGMMLKATASLRPNDAAVLGVGTQNFSLPPGQPSVSRSGECQLSQPMHIFNYSPHMHLLGKAATLERIRNGQTTMLADVPEFAFESQIGYEAAFDLVPGDVLKTTCTWDTTSRTQTTGFGEGTEDEMCYMFIAHYPPFGEYSCGN